MVDLGPGVVDYGSIPTRVASLESEIVYLRHMISSSSDAVTNKLAEELMAVLIKRLQSLKLIRL